MNTAIKFLIDNYFNFAGLVFFLVLACLGYIIDTFKTEKLKKEFIEKYGRPTKLPKVKLK